MIRLKLTLILAAGIGTWIWLNWQAAIVAAIVTALVWRRPAPTQTIFTMDHNTGAMKPQPMDEAARRYLRGRD